MIDLDSIVMLHYASIVEFLVDLVLTKSMLNVVVLYLIGPTIVKVVNLACHFATVFQVKGFVDFAKTTLAQNRQNQVLIIKHSEGFASVDTAVL